MCKRLFPRVLAVILPVLLTGCVEPGVSVNNREVLRFAHELLSDQELNYNLNVRSNITGPYNENYTFNRRLSLKNVNQKTYELKAMTRPEKTFYRIQFHQETLSRNRSYLSPNGHRVIEDTPGVRRSRFSSFTAYTGLDKVGRPYFMRDNRGLLAVNESGRQFYQLNLDSVYWLMPILPFETEQAGGLKAGDTWEKKIPVAILNSPRAIILSCSFRLERMYEQQDVLGRPALLAKISYTLKGRYPNLRPDQMNMANPPKPAATILWTGTCVFDVYKYRVVSKNERGRVWVDYTGIKTEVVNAGTEQERKITQTTHQDFDWVWSSEMELTGLNYDFDLNTGPWQKSNPPAKPTTDHVPAEREPVQSLDPNNLLPTEPGSE